MYAPTVGTVTPSQCWARAESRHALASTELPGTGRAAAVTSLVSASMMSYTFAENR